MLNTEFLGSAAGATADSPTPEPQDVSAGATETPSVEPADVAAPTDAAPLTPPAEEPAVEAPQAEEGREEPQADEPVDPDAQPDEEEEIRKVLEDPSTPAFARKKIQEAWSYAGKLKAARNNLQSEIERIRQEAEGREVLPPEDVERLRQAEEFQYKLGSFSSEPRDIIESLKSVMTPTKLQDVKVHLAWDFLETPEGKPDLENLQVIVDRFAGHQEGQTRVNAKDVLNAINALKQGTIQPHELHEFSSDAEYEAYQRSRAVEQQIEEQRKLAQSNAQFQERQTRQTVISNAMVGLQGEVQPKVESLLDRFHLQPQPGEPKVATEFKEQVRQQVAQVMNEAASTNPALSDVFKALSMLGEPTGATPDVIQQEIQGYIQSFSYRSAVNKGLSELMSNIEKVVSREAYRYKLMMMGYEAEVSKGANARKIVDKPNQTTPVKDYTPEELARMSADERRHHTLKSISDQLRATRVPRFGG